jgi:hypothetical protein
MPPTRDLTRADVRAQLVLILVKASRRGRGRVLSPVQAAGVLDRLIADPADAAWAAVREGGEQLRLAIQLLSELPEETR